MSIKSKIKSLIYLMKTDKKIPIIQIEDKSKLLNNKVALILGGDGGIGFAIAKEYAKAGAKIILLGRNINKLKKCKEVLNQYSTSDYIIADLYETSEFHNILTKAISIFGKIDILVCSAGMHINKKGLSFLNSTEEEYDRIMNLNLKGTYFFCQEFSKYMINNKIKGHILIISSQSELEPAWSPYRLSKWGEKGLTQGLAQVLLKYDIVVNSIAPGPTATDMQNYKEGESIDTRDNPIFRYTMPEEIAEYALLLVSDLGNTIIGDKIYMSGRKRNNRN